MLNDNDSIHHQLLQWFIAGRRLVVATVIKTWGSAPRPVGARLLVAENTEFCGSVSGGCIEGAIITAAGEVIRSQQVQTLSFTVANQAAWEVGLSCGGNIDVFLQPVVDLTIIRAMQSIQANRQSAVLVTNLTDGQQQLLMKDASLGTCFPAAVIQATSQESSEGNRQPRQLSVDDTAYFVEWLSPQPRLLIIGATHITQTLLPLATAMSFASMVIDPRQAWATEARFPAVDLRCQWPDQALPTVSVGASDAVVTLTHDPKIDDPALLLALNADPFYIGALGSRRTHAARLARLQEAGVSAIACQRIAAPVGLSIGAVTAAEIALSIIAQVVSVYRQQHNGRPLHQQIFHSGAVLKPVSIDH